MNSSIAAMTGEFEACWRFLIDATGLESDEFLLVINASGIDAALERVKQRGYGIEQILDYSVC